MSTERPPHFVSHRYMWFVYYTECDRTYCCTHLGFVPFLILVLTPAHMGMRFYAVLNFIRFTLLVPTDNISAHTIFFRFSTIHIARPQGCLSAHAVASLRHTIYRDTHRSPTRASRHTPFYFYVICPHRLNRHTSLNFHRPCDSA